MGVGAGGGGGAPGAALAALEGEADYWASLRDLREAVAWAGERPPAGGAAAEGGGGGGVLQAAARPLSRRSGRRHESGWSGTGWRRGSGTGWER